MVRTVIPHLDDVGMCHGANHACLELMGHGFVASASVMVPCPWFPELAAAAAGREDLDLGIHLTLTSEWPGYRWRALSTARRASGLIDDDGYMWRDVPSLRARLDPMDLEPGTIALFSKPGSDQLTGITGFPGRRFWNCERHCKADPRATGRPRSGGARQSG